MVLLESLPKLEVLRVPFNEVRDSQAVMLIERLQKGLSVTLRELDLSNSVGSDFVPKAVQWHSNGVSAATLHALEQILAHRRGCKIEAPATPLPTTPVLPQTGEYPRVERAKTNRSSCVVCAQKIEKDALRVGVARTLERVGQITAWLHYDCRAQCAEFLSDGALEARLQLNAATAETLAARASILPC